MNLGSQRSSNLSYLIVSNSRESVDAETQNKLNNSFLPHVEKYSESLFNMKSDFTVLISNILTHV